LGGGRVSKLKEAASARVFSQGPGRRGVPGCGNTSKLRRPNFKWGGGKKKKYHSGKSIDGSDKETWGRAPKRGVLRKGRVIKKRDKKQKCSDRQMELIQSQGWPVGGTHLINGGKPTLKWTGNIYKVMEKGGGGSFSIRKGKPPNLLETKGVVIRKKTMLSVRESQTGRKRPFKCRSWQKKEKARRRKFSGGFGREKTFRTFARGNVPKKGLWRGVG